MRMTLLKYDRQGVVKMLDGDKFSVQINRGFLVIMVVFIAIAIIFPSYIYPRYIKDSIQARLDRDKIRREAPVYDSVHDVEAILNEYQIKYEAHMIMYEQNKDSTYDDIRNQAIESYRQAESVREYYKAAYNANKGLLDTYNSEFSPDLVK